jgi:hypothetical protein
MIIINGKAYQIINGEIYEISYSDAGIVTIKCDPSLLQIVQNAIDRAK